MRINDLFAKLGVWTVRHAGAILILSGGITLAAGFGAAKLGIETDLAAMLPDGNATAKAYTRIDEAFGSTASMIVVAEGPDRDSLVEAAAALENAIGNSVAMRDLVRSVDWKMNREFAETWGLLAQKAEDIADSGRILADRSLAETVRAANDVMEEGLADGSDDEVTGPDGERDAAVAMTRFALFSRALGEAFRAAGNGGEGRESLSEATERMADAWLFGEEYLIDPEERTLIVSVRPSFDIGDRAKLRKLSAGMRALCDDIASARPGVAFGLTGDAENEAAEERAMGADVLYPSLIAVAVIAVLFLFSFRRMRSILLALVAMGVGILWDVGFASVAVGKLNMITSSFGALLVGLGIDFGIHLSSRYDEEIAEGLSPELAMGRAFGSVGFPIAVGGVTTAIAFYMLLLSKTPSFREFALIAGTGIVTTLIASFTALPALLALLSKPGASRFPNRPLIPFRAAHSLIALASKRRAAALSLVALSVVLLAPGLFRNAFEFDMRKIGPQGTEAQRFERLVESRFGISTWQHMALADDIAGAEALVAAYEKAPLVRDVESVADYVPSAAEQEARLAAIARLSAGFRETPAAHAYTEADVGAFLFELERMEWNVVELGDLAAASLGEGSLPVRARSAIVREIFGAETGAAGEEVFASLRQSIASLQAAEAASRLAAVNALFSAALDRRYARLLAVSSPITVADLPESVRNEFVSPDGSGYLVRIVPSAGLSGDAAFEAFADGLAAAAPGATGTLVLGLELSREVLGESARVAVLVAIAVFALVSLGFGSLRLTGAALVAFAVAVAWTFSVAPWFGKFNIVSALSLPLIIGIGVDYCVHVVSALRHGDAVSVARTSRAMTLSMLTTLIGFGSLALIGSFRGIAALGTTLSIGIVASYTAAIIVIPALLGPKAAKNGGK